MYKDRVYETSTSTGTGNFTLAGAEAGYVTFTSAFGTSAAYYVIVNRAVPSEWEIGSFTVSGTTLARVAGNVLAGSGGTGVLVNFSSGIKDVYNSPPASRMTTWDTAITSASGSGSEYGHFPRVTSVSLSKSGTAATISVGTACNCNCACDCNCRC
jgi:hypothetical protein